MVNHPNRNKRDVALRPDVPAVPQSPIPRDIVKLIAMDIGKAVAAHIETMYPDAVAAVGSTFLLSVRNCTHNEIMAALDTSDVDAILARLDRRKVHRRQIKAMAKACRAMPG